jgi:hypothetical protein
MKKFKDFGIETEKNSFTGEKTKMHKVLNREIIIHDYLIEDSKFDNGNGKRLKMQIEVQGVKHLLFHGSVLLQNTIQKIPKDNFPFTTTIIKENDRLTFS